jgi:type IV secretory pathway VirB4 component
VGPTGAGKSVLLALMALQFRRYPNSQVFAFDFGGSIRAAALAMGGDWHDLGGALSDGDENPVALQPLAWIEDPSERGWATEWIGAILAREKVEITPEVKDHLWSALTSRFGAEGGADPDGLVSPAPIELSETRLATLLPRRTFRALARRRIRAPWRSLGPGV